MICNICHFPGSKMQTNWEYYVHNFMLNQHLLHSNMFLWTGNTYSSAEEKFLRSSYSYHLVKIYILEYDLE